MLTQLKEYKIIGTRGKKMDFYKNLLLLIAKKSLLVFNIIFKKCVPDCKYPGRDPCTAVFHSGDSTSHETVKTQSNSKMFNIGPLK